MAKREISSTLKNLKFMQRATQREEKLIKKEEVIPDGNFSSPGITRKCVVIMEGDPHPGAVVGRISFGSFNPSVDKLNEEATNTRSPEVSNSHQSENATRENDQSSNEAECSNTAKPKTEANGDLKRKHTDVVSETDYQESSPNSVQGGQHSSQNSNKGSLKQPKCERLDWNVLRAKGQKHQNQRR